MPEDKKESRWVIPPHVTALSEEELETQLNIYLDKDNGKLSHQDAEVQRILATLVQERQNVARLRHWVAMAGSNTAKPTAEAKVSFIAMSAALDLIMGTPEDLRDAISILNTAVTQVALSQAGKLDLDVAEWAARDLEHQKKKPMVNMLLGHGPFHVLDGKPDASSGSVQHETNAEGKALRVADYGGKGPLMAWNEHSITFEEDDDGDVCGHIALEGGSKTTESRWGWSVTANGEGRNEPAIIAEGQEDTPGDSMNAAEKAYIAWKNKGVQACPECGLIPGQLKGPYCMKCGRINGSPS